MTLDDVIDDQLRFAEQAAATLEAAEISRSDAGELYSEALERLTTAEEHLLDDTSDTQCLDER
jgi:hypothetical protein